MPARKGLLAPQNTFLDTIATRFDGTHSNFVLGNAKIAKVYPIVYCSDGFCELTGYLRAQIMQKSCDCNFLYGQKTDVQHREAISRALTQKQELKLEVILYRSSGTPFWCLLDIVPIQDEKHEVVLFLCSHKDITKQKLHEQQQHQLAQLHAQKQQQLADHHQQAGATAELTFSDGSQQGQQPPLASSGSSQKLDDVDEAELTAIANKNALISMDGFDLNHSGQDNDFDEADDSEDQDKHTANQYSRRRSRAVLYQLSGHYGYRRSVNMKSKLKLNNRMNIPEYKTTTIEKQRFILSHYGLGKSCWDWLILVVSFYVAIVVPYNATFKDKQQDLEGECRIDSIDILVEVVFVIDVILNFRTTFVNRKGEVVTRPKIICRHYIRGWFIVDACAALPFDLLCNSNLYRSRLDLNLLKLIRLLRLARLLQKMDRYSQYSYIILTLLMLIFSLLAHWCACIWYVIAMEEIERNPPDWRIGWLHQLSDKLGYSVVNATDMASSYVTALYFTTSSLTSVGFGNVSANTNAEKVFSIVIMLIGALMHAVVFGNVTALIRVMYARRSNYQTRLRDLKDFFRLHQLPKELQQRMSDYFQTTWSLNHGIETYEILKDFPEELRGDVSLHLHREVLSLPIFETAPQGFLKSLARHIESKFCCPTEYLIHRGDALNYLYLVCNGSMEVLQDNMVVAILGKGDLVGYDVNVIATPEHTQYGLSKAASILGGSMGLVKSSSDLKALTYCDLKCIHISGLLEVLKLYPEFSDIFQQEILHDLSFNLRETHADDLNDDTDDELAPGDSHSGEGYELHNGRGSPPPAPRMSHLYHSITSPEEDQIGRYDHDERQEHDDEDDNEDEDDNDEQHEVDEDNDDESDNDDDDDNVDHSGQPDDRDGSDGDHDDDGTGNSQMDPHEDQRDPDQSHKMSDSSGNSADSSQSTRHATSYNTNTAEFKKNRPLVLSGSFAESLEKSLLLNMEEAPIVGKSADSGAILRHRTGRGPEDSRSLHSYDGLIESSKRTRKGPSEAVRKLNKINSHEFVLSEQFVANKTATRLRPALGKSPMTTRKPPISFDLSRNTTAIVDRRRSSAGCISRPLLVGPPSASGRVSGHSSLLHISENGPTRSARKLTSVSGQQRAGPAGTSSSCGVSMKQGINKLVRTQHGSVEQQQQRPNKPTRSYSSQEIKSIEARIVGLSTHVNEMKVELNQCRATMQMFMQFVNKQTNKLMANLSDPGANINRQTDARSRLIHPAGRNVDVHSIFPIPKSLSTTSLQTVSQHTTLMTGASRLGSGSLHSAAPHRILCGDSEPQELCRPILSSSKVWIGSIRANSQDGSRPDDDMGPIKFTSSKMALATSTPVPSQVNWTSENVGVNGKLAPTGPAAGLRPVSQCSSQSVGQSFSSRVNLNSDDSGRSSSSVNLPSGLYGLQGPYKSASAEQHARMNLIQDSGELAKAELSRSLSYQTRPAGGRIAKVLVAATTADKDADDSAKRYTIDIGELDQGLMVKGSIV